MSSPREHITDSATTFAREVIAPQAEHWEKIGRVPYEVFEQGAAIGLCGLMVPESLGGQGLGVRGMASVAEIIAGACMSSAFSFIVHNNLAAHISRLGTPIQIGQHVTEMIQGRKIGAFLLTEPTVGSDAQSISTFAERTSSGWVINGEKAWVSNGSFADLLSVYVQTEDGAGAKGVAAFLVDAKAPGVIREDSYNLMRGHALGAAGFRFEQCEVNEDMMLAAPGDAFKAAMSGINTARINVAAMCCGILSESLRQAINYAEQRHAFGQSTLEFQALQFQLADVATNLEAALALTSHATALAESGDDVTLSAAHAKKFATKTAFTGIAECMQAMGAAGYSAKYSLARHLASAKMAQFLDGTTEIQNLVIGRALRPYYGG